MEDTSERILITEERKDEADYYVYLLHLASYNFAASFSDNKKVLDFGCGTGYGSQILSRNSESVVGIDISSDAIQYARDNYSGTTLNFEILDQAILPFSDSAFDLITSFQVIEHIEDADSYLSEMKRVLKPGGKLLLSTPDKKTRLFLLQRPWNYYHINEYSIKTLFNLLSKYFKDVDILKIGGDKRLVFHELKRRRFTRLVTLPFTLIIFPDVIRKFFLRLLKKVYYTKPDVLENGNEIFRYTIEDIIIKKDVIIHSDLMAICKR